MTPAGAPAGPAVPGSPRLILTGRKEKSKAKTHLKTHQPLCIFVLGRVGKWASSCGGGGGVCCPGLSIPCASGAPAPWGLVWALAMVGTGPHGACPLKCLLWASRAQLLCAPADVPPTAGPLHLCLSKPGAHSHVASAAQQPCLVRGSNPTGSSTHEAQRPWGSAELSP